MSGSHILVPVSDSPTLRQTVEYAVERALEQGAGGTVTFAHLQVPDLHEDSWTTGTAEPGSTDVPESEHEELLGRVAVWAAEDADGRALTVNRVELATDRYLFSPSDVASLIAEEARSADVDTVVLDPEYDPGIGSPFLRPLERELEGYADLDVVEAPVSRPARRAPLLRHTSAVQIGAIFGISFLFYQVLAGTISAFDLVTGGISAIIVAVGLSRVTFATDPTRLTFHRILRMFLFVPYLVVEIVRANVQVAAVILHPTLPIDPKVVRVRPAVWGGLPITTLANSITLTPGTLTMRVRGRNMTVHTLVPAAREGLFDGDLERAVRYVFYGKMGARIPSLRERGDFEVLDSKESTETQSAGTRDETHDGGEAE